jgi:hypothetical protein
MERERVFFERYELLTVSIDRGLELAGFRQLVQEILLVGHPPSFICHNSQHSIFPVKPLPWMLIGIIIE